jgi:excisionase family DNA binding protein
LQLTRRRGQNREKSEKNTSAVSLGSAKNRQKSAVRTVKNIGKNQRSADSYGVSEAAALLGVSIPTLKRIVAEGRVESFRTPGGHLRILAESIEAVREERPRVRPVRDASPVLQNRREHLEELTLEAQEHRARRELAKLEREEREEAAEREAEVQAREEETAQRQAELELERERLEHDKAQERRRLERERSQELERMEAEQELAEFRQRWYEAASTAMAAPKLGWLTPGQRKEVIEALEAEIERRQPADEPRLAAILARSLEAALGPFRAEHNAEERRQRLTEEALRALPYSATEAEKARASAAIREALKRFDAFADVYEMRIAAQEAAQPARQAAERRLLSDRLLRWAIYELPWNRTDQDEARVRRECTEILSELPPDATEPEAREALEPTVHEARRIIDERQARKERETRKRQLVEQGVAEVSSYLLTLKDEGEISSKDYWNSEFNDDLKGSVRRGLEAELSGEESGKEVRELTREIIHAEID